jgi:hypothetical protein
MDDNLQFQNMYLFFGNRLCVTDWVLAPCDLIVGYQRFVGTFCLPEDGGGKFL